MARKGNIDEILLEETKEDVMGSRADEPTPARESPPVETLVSEAQQSTDGTITLDDFLKSDMRIGRILEAEDVPGARKPMYKLRVDLGDLGVRTIVAGIGAYYTKEELIDKRIAVVVNLKPRSIAGQMSHGMLLAAEDGDIISVLSPDRGVKAGSAIR
jgi:methionine--tRNA ligase beta chain